MKGYTYREIAKALNISPATVCRAIDKVTKGNDYQLATKSIASFLTDFQTAADYFKMQMRDLESLKNGLAVELDEGTDERGRPYTSKTKVLELKLKIIEMQCELNARCLEQVKQGQVAKALQLLRDNKIKVDKAIDEIESKVPTLKQVFPNESK